MRLQGDIVNALVPHADFAFADKRIIVGGGRSRVRLLYENTVDSVGLDVAGGGGSWPPHLTIYNEAEFGSKSGPGRHT